MLSRVRAPMDAHSPTRRVRRTGLAAFAWWVPAALLIPAAVPAPLAGQISVDQAELYLQPQAASANVTSFNVRNESNQTVEATVYVMDWTRDEDGQNQFVPAGSQPQSCFPYLRVFPLSLRLDPGTQQAVRIGLQGADSLPATCWSIIFVEARSGGATSGRRVSYVMRLGVKLYITPSGLSKDGEVEDMSIDTLPAGAKAPADTAKEPHVHVAFRNSGGLPYWVHGSVEYRRLDNSVAATDSVTSFPILPGARRRFATLVPKLPAGHYVALVLLDYGGAEVAAGQLPLDVP